MARNKDQQMLFVALAVYAAIATVLLVVLLIRFAADKPRGAAASSTLTASRADFVDATLSAGFLIARLGDNVGASHPADTKTTLGWIVSGKQVFVNVELRDGLPQIINESTPSGQSTVKVLQSFAGISRQQLRQIASEALASGTAQFKHVNGWIYLANPAQNETEIILTKNF